MQIGERLEHSPEALSENRQLVIVGGMPKSGLTWLTRLLADVLNCPAAGSYSGEDRNDIVSEGWDRPDPYLVRKGHYKLDKDLLEYELGCLLPYTHILLPAYLTNERLVFIIRDPRDLIVSAKHHWSSRPIDTIIEQVCYGGLTRLPAWDVYIKQWQEIDGVRLVRYEDLLGNALNEVQYLLNGLDYDKARLIPAIQRQSFGNRLKQIHREGDGLYLGKNYNLKFMRKGISGDWVNHLTDVQNRLICDRLGDMMGEMGYATSLHSD